MKSSATKTSGSRASAKSSAIRPQAKTGTGASRAADDKGENRAESHFKPLARAIGNTPLVALELKDLPRGVRLFAKLESANPTGSHKDRVTSRLITQALAGGRLRGERRLLDAAGGDAGVSYATFAAVMGLPLTLVMSEKTPSELLDRVRAHGAELILTPSLGTEAAITKARSLAAEHPEQYVFCDQYGNEESWRAHHDSTGHELLTQVFEATGEVPDALVVGVDSGATLTGVGRRLRRRTEKLTITAVQPLAGMALEGLKRIDPSPEAQRALDPSLIDRYAFVPTDLAVAMCRRLALLGFFVGQAAGAQVHAALTLAREKKHKLLVTFLSESGDRSFSTGLWHEPVNASDRIRRRRAK